MKGKPDQRDHMIEESLNESAFELTLSHFKNDYY